MRTTAASHSFVRFQGVRRSRRKLTLINWIGSSSEIREPVLALGADIVAIKSVLKKVATLYEPAVMLEFETTDSSRERQVAFAVEGQLSEDYELCFARARGPEVLADILHAP